jgi:hypothetical protein
MIMSGTFLGELVWSVVVRAAGHDHPLPESLVAGQRDQIGPGFARGIRRTGINRRLFGKFSRVAQRSINFIRRDLDEALDAMPARAIEQDACPDHIRMNEVLRRINAPIDVRFRGKLTTA